MGLIRQYGKSFVVGVLGVVVAIALWHAYLDHKNLHTLMSWAVSQAAKSSVAVKPPE